jgi:CheY-like chemotaxis protein
MLKMLQRLIGEDITLLWMPHNNLWQIYVDPSQIDQILANLCVNARDAITGIGKISIKTSNIVFNSSDSADSSNAASGENILLSVSDNGKGMDQETLAHIFEPFFTTKKEGEGTGLGLATVYGIVKQNNGYINVESQLGQGTTFNIYLPRYVPKAPEIKEPEVAYSSIRGDETILLVEDETAILKMVKAMLESQGYTVLAASSPGEAISLVESHKAQIHILITDVIMPEMNGRELVNKLQSNYPGLKHLFMSGYTANVIAPHGVLDDGIHFIQKPFGLRNLSKKIRDILDENSP